MIGDNGAEPAQEPVNALQRVNDAVMKIGIRPALRVAFLDSLFKAGKDPASVALFRENPFQKIDDLFDLQFDRKADEIAAVDVVTARKRRGARRQGYRPGDKRIARRSPPGACGLTLSSLRLAQITSNRRKSRKR